MRLAVLAVALSVLFGNQAPAVILQSTGDPTAHTNAPTGDLTDSGWNLQGQWGGFLGTPIASQYFITAKHIGGTVGNSFNFRGSNYTTTAKYDHPTSDLTIWKIGTSFPEYAKLQRLRDTHVYPSVVHGRGGPRGASFTNQELCSVIGVTQYAPKGWFHSASDGIMRWGSGTVSAGEFSWDCGDHYREYATSQHTFGSDSNSFALSEGDSGGGLFSRSASEWTLSGIAYGTQGSGPYKFHITDPDGSAFYAAVTNSGGLVAYNHSFGTWNVPCISGIQSSSAVFTLIRPHLDWIYSVIGGLVIYTYHSDSILFTNCGFAMNIGGAIGSSLTIETSTNLTSWQTAQTISVSGTTAFWEHPSAGNYSRLFYRVRSGTNAYSMNAVGFYKVTIGSSSSTNDQGAFVANSLYSYNGSVPGAFSLIGNNPPEGTVLFVWNKSTQSYEPNSYEFGAWSDPSQIIAPGTGFYVIVPAGEVWTMVFTGEVPKTFNGTIVPGMNMMGHSIPKSVTASQLPFSPTTGDTIYKLTSGSGSSGSWTFDTFTYIGSAWSPSDPQFAVGEGFWFESSKTNSTNYQTTFSVW